MQSSGLAAVYQAKADEELLLLAHDLDQLTTEARSYLLGELARRRLEIPQQAPERNRSGPLDSHEAKSFPRLFVEDSRFLKKVMSVYWDHSFTFRR